MQNEEFITALDASVRGIAAEAVELLEAKLALSGALSNAMQLKHRMHRDDADAIAAAGVRLVADKLAEALSPVEVARALRRPDLEAMLVRQTSEVITQRVAEARALARVDAEVIAGITRDGIAAPTVPMPSRIEVHG